jgi:hypothetical protein
MFISVPKSNPQYIEELKERGFIEVIGRVRNKNVILLANHEVNPIFIVGSNVRSYKPVQNQGITECPHCEKILHRCSLAKHIKAKHSKKQILVNYVL